MLIYILAGLCAVSLIFAYGAFMMQTHALDETRKAIRDLQSEYGENYTNLIVKSRLEGENICLTNRITELTEINKAIMSPGKSDKFFIYDGHMYAKYRAELKEESTGEKILDVEFTEVNV